MTKKDYLLISKHFAQLVAPYHGDGPLSDTDKAYLSGVNDSMKAVADAFQQDNRNFDRNRFLMACGFCD